MRYRVRTPEGELEYENFNVPNTSGARVVSLSVFLNLL